MYSVEKTRGLNLFRQFDYAFFIAILILSAIGILVLSSATLTMKSGSRMMTIQIVSLALGIIIALILGAMDYKDFKILGIVFYIISIFLLVVVLFIGKGETDWGSKSWLRFGGIGIQPAELAQITFVIIVSIFLERIKEGNPDKKNILKLFFYTALPIGLVMLQPDFGMVIVFLFMFIVLIFVYGIKYKLILAGAGTFLLSLPFLWFFVLNDNRKSRIFSFLNPEADPLGSGFNVMRSKTAIGSGQFLGKGIYQGIQTQNQGVPVRESDFIFSVVGEELGFIGAVIIIILIAFILLKCLHIAKNSRDLFGSFLVVGLTGMMGIHFIENIGMCIGLLPVTGIPLPFVSYGGSAMVTNYIAVGIILSVSIRRRKVIFNNSQ